LLYRRTVALVYTRQEEVERELARSRLEAIDAIELVRPREEARREVPFPTADVGELLGDRELALDPRNVIRPKASPPRKAKRSNRAVAATASSDDRLVAPSILASRHHGLLVRERACAESARACARLRSLRRDYSLGISMG